MSETLDRIYRAENSGPRHAMDVVVNDLDDLQNDGKFSDVDAVFEAANTEKLSDSSLVGMLGITSAASKQGKFRHRATFYDRAIASVAKRRGRDGAEKLLAKYAFTLVELLVVIAIIGILVALLLPFTKENTPAWSVATGGVVNPLFWKGSTMISVKESALKVQAGQRYGKWEVLGIPFSNGHQHSVLRWACVAKCWTCGIATVLPCIYLRKGHRHGAKCDNCQHGEGNVGRVTRLYGIWSCMRNRCKNPNNHAFDRYGGRGISVCREWEQYKVFKRWALGNGYQENLTIDRIDNDGNYEPDNCRWITKAAQNRNTRHNRLVTAFGETKTLAEWSEDVRCLVSYDSLKARLKSGWEPERAIASPKQRQGRTA